MMRRLSLVCASMLLLGGVWTAAQTPPPSEEAAPADAAAQAKAEFYQRFEAYKEAIRSIEQLRTDYQVADPATREELNRQLEQRIDQTGPVLDAVVSAAEKAYQLAPNTDAQITDLLVAVAKYYAVGEPMPGSDAYVRGGEQYEKALPIIRLLIDGGAPEPQLPLWGLVCAYVTNDYDLAEKYLQMAQESNLLASPPSGGAGRPMFVLAMQYAEKPEESRQAWAKESAIRAAEAEADDLPRVKLTTTKGDIVLELFENEAPQSVANFLTLVKQGFYDGVTFHRVLPKFMAQGGDPNGDGSGDPGYYIRCECYEPNARQHFRGSLSMANRGRDTGGSQFFLTFVPTSHLDGKHTVFGRVVEGMDVLGQLQQRDPATAKRRAVLPEPDEILRAEVLRDRGHDYSFERLPK